MNTDELFEARDGNKSMGKKLRETAAYTATFLPLAADVQLLRSDAIIRNNEWRDKAQAFMAQNSSRTDCGKLNNSFYRTRMQYDVVVPYSVYKAIMDYYLYSVEERIVEEVEFIQANLDSIMTFCHLIDYYNGRYKSYLHTKRFKTPLAAKMIESFIGREYRKVIAFLEKLDIIDMDRWYIPAKWDTKAGIKKKGICRHFSFSIERDGRYCVYQVTSRRIISRVYATKTKFDELDYVKENANTVKDKPLNNWFSEHFELSHTAFQDRAKDYDGFNYYNSRVSNTTRFENFTIGRDKFGHRLYHPFLNMNKELRKHTAIDGSTDTTVIDINNSHPFFFSMLFNATFLEYVSHLITQEELDVFRSMSVDPEFAEKVNLFSQITGSGNYYNFLRENVKSDRDLKELNMYYFYGKLNKRNAIFRFFEKNFDFVNKVKVRLIKIGGYKRLCQILQQVEAYVMIDKVFYGLKEGGYSVMPLHDAMMCKTQDADAVKDYIVKVFQEIGVEPPVFDKEATFTRIKNTVEEVRKKNFNLFINKGLMMEELNSIIKTVGIRNRVFSERMKPESIVYIDTRFEDQRHLIDDDLAGKYYDLRTMMDTEKYNNFDFTPLYSEFKSKELMKKKFFARDVVGYVPANPIEFLNHIHGTELKTRLNENGYIY